MLAPAYSTTLERILAEMKDYEAKIKSTVSDITVLLEEKTIAQGKESVSYELVMRRGEQYRIEQTQSDTSAVERPTVWPITVFDGKTIWLIDSAGNKTMAVFDDWRIRPYVSWDWSSLISPKSTLTGVDDLGGRSAYSIELPPGWLNLPFTSIWISAESGQKPVLVRTKSNRLLVAYSEFQPVLEGVELPYRVDTFSDGGDFITMTTVKSVEVNQGISPGLFNPDSAEVKVTRIQAMLNRLQLIEEK
jgi:outer membrane lipoprotein-sorting protein